MPTNILSKLHLPDSSNLSGALDYERLAQDLGINLEDYRNNDDNEEVSPLGTQNESNIGKEKYFQFSASELVDRIQEEERIRESSNKSKSSAFITADGNIKSATAEADTGSSPVTAFIKSFRNGFAAFEISLKNQLGMIGDLTMMTPEAGTNFGDFVFDKETNTLKVMSPMETMSKWWNKTASEIENFEKVFPTPKEYQGSFWLDKLPRGLASAAGFWAIGILTGGLGAASAKASAYMGGVVGSLSESQFMGAEAIGAGASDEVATAAALLGAATGATEGIPISKAFERVYSTVGKGALKDILWGALKEGGEEAFQESILQQLPESIFAKLTYDKRRDIIESVWEGGAIGFLSGSFMGGLMHTIGQQPGMNTADQQTFNEFVKEYKDNLRKSVIAGLKDISINDKRDDFKGKILTGSGNFSTLNEDTKTAIKKVSSRNPIFAQEAIKKAADPKFDDNIISMLYIYGQEKYKAAAEEMDRNPESIGDMFSDKELASVSKNVYDRVLTRNLNTSLAWLVDNTDLPKGAISDLIVLRGIESGEEGYGLFKSKWGSIINNQDLDEAIAYAKGIEIGHSPASIVDETMHKEFFENRAEIDDVETIIEKAEEGLKDISDFFEEEREEDLVSLPESAEKTVSDVNEDINNIEIMYEANITDDSEESIIVEELGARYEGIDSSGNVTFTNRKTGGTFTINKSEFSKEKVQEILANDKNEPLTEPLPSKATKEEIAQLFQKKTPESITTNPTYGEQFNNFDGKRLSDALDFTEINGVSTEDFKDLHILLRKLVGNVSFRVGKTTNGEPGMTEFIADMPILITINKNTIGKDSHSVYRTILHEGVHALTLHAMRMQTPEGKAFRGQIHGLMKDVSDVIYGTATGPRKFNYTTLSQTQLESIKQRHNEDLEYYLKNPEEFISGVLSRTSILPSIMGTIHSYKPATKSNSILSKVVDSIVKFIKDTIGKLKAQNKSYLVLSEKNALDAFESILESFTPTIESAHKARMKLYSSKTERKLKEEIIKETEISSDLENNEYDPGEFTDDVDLSDTGMVDVEHQDDITTFKSFINLLANLQGITVTDHYKYLKLMDSESFRTLIDTINDSNNNVINKFIKDQYDLIGRHRIQDYNEYKDNFITEKFNLAQRLSPKEMVSIILTRDGQKKSFSVKKVGSFDGTQFITSKGKRKTNYLPDYPLEKYVVSLEKILGLESGTLNPVLVHDFALYNKERLIKSVNINKLTPDFVGYSNNQKGLHLQEEDVFKRLVTLLWGDTEITDNLSKKEGQNLTKKEQSQLALSKAEYEGKYSYLSIGTLEGGNTFPLIAIHKRDKTKVAKILNDFISKWASSLGNRSAANLILSQPQALRFSMGLRLMLEELWYNADISKVGTPEFRSKIENLDLKKILKRGKKWSYSITTIDDSQNFISKKFPEEKFKKFIGISIKDNPETGKSTLYSRAAIINSRSVEAVTDKIFDKGEVDLTDLENQLKEYELLLNKSGVPLTDGTIFYIIGHFDKVYKTLHGALKNGALKNVLGSYPGQPSLFLKHAMHGVSIDSPIGKLMAKNNLALLISDEAAKVGTENYGKVSLKNLSNRELIKEDDKRVLNIPISQFARIKEEHSISHNNGVLKQLMNGSGGTSNSPIFMKVKNGDQIDEIFGNVIENIIKNYQDKINSMDDEYKLNRLERIVRLPSSPKQEAISKIIKKYIGDDDLSNRMEDLKGFLRHPMVAEIFQNDIKKELDNVLNQRTFGYRAALQSDLGTLNDKACVNPIISTYNKKSWILSLPETDPILSAAVGKENVTLVKEWVESQKALSRATVKRNKNSIKRYRERILEIKSELGVNRIFDMINTEDNKVKEWMDSLLDRVTDPKTNRLKEGYAIISSDDASRYGIKPGDTVLVIVTPTDSFYSVAAVKVAAIAQVGDSVDNNKVILNSDYIQTKVGKDYDIDTIAVIPYDEEYWSKKEFDILSQVIEDAKKEYTNQIVAAVKSLLVKEGTSILDKENVPIDINEETIFRDEVRVPVAQIMNGVKEGKEKFDPIDPKDYWRLTQDFSKSKVGLIIQERLLSNTLTSIGLKAKNVKIKIGPKGNNTYDFDALHNEWVLTHYLHMIMTNHIVDFPNNTSALYYESDMSDPSVRHKMMKHMLGVKSTTTSAFTQTESEALRNFFDLIFRGAFNLSKGIDYYTGKSLTLYDALRNIKRQQQIFKLLEPNESGHITESNINVLLKMFSEHLMRSVDRHQLTQQEALIRYDFIEEFINKLTIEDLYNYPLFREIARIDYSKMPDLGNTYLAHLANESQIPGQMLLSVPQLLETYENGILAEATKEKKDFFTGEHGSIAKAHDRGFYESISLKGVEYGVDNASIAASLITRQRDFEARRTNSKNNLEVVKRASIAIISAIEESFTFASATSKDAALNQLARQIAYPRLVGVLLNKPTIQFSKDYFNLRTKGLNKLYSSEYGTIEIFRDIDGSTTIRHTDKNNVQTMIKQEELLRSDTKVYEGLTSPFGYFSDAKNRATFSSLIKFQQNLSIEDRLNIVKDYVASNVYDNEAFGFIDQKAFWISLLGQTTNNGLKDAKAINFMVNRTPFEGTNVYKYQYNNIFLELLDIFDPSLLKEYIINYNFNSIEIDDLTLEETLNTGIDDTEILYQGVFEPASPESEFRFMVNQNVKNFADLGSVRKEIGEFKRVLRKEGTEGGLKKLNELISNISVAQALSANEIFMKNIIYDIKKLTPSQFDKKYSEYSSDVIDQAIGIATQKNKDFAQDFLSSSAKTRLENKLLFLYWTFLKMGKPFAESADKKLLWYKRNPTSFDLTAMEGEKKRLHSSDEEVSFLMDYRSEEPKILLSSDVQNSRRFYATSTPLAFGESTVAHAKQKGIATTTSSFRAKMNTSMSNFSRILDFIVDNKSAKAFFAMHANESAQNSKVKLMANLANKLDKEYIDRATLHKEIFDLAQNLRAKEGIRVEPDPENPKDVWYIKQNKKDKIVEGYRELDKFIETYNIGNGDALTTLKYIAAFELRYIFDVMVPSLLRTSSNYLKLAYTDTLDKGQKLEARSILKLISRYDEYIYAASRRQGNYLPHQYDMETFKFLWEDAYRDSFRRIALREVMKDPKLYSQIGHDKESIERLTEDKMYNAWEALRMGLPETAIIPNFLKREFEHGDYNKSDSSVFFNYINRLTEGVFQDMLMADYFSYLGRAKSIGENRAIIEKTRMWFADQLKNKSLHTRPIQISNLKKGMEIEFYKVINTPSMRGSEPIGVETAIWGKIQEIDKDKIQIYVDKKRVQDHVAKMLDAYNSTYKQIMEYKPTSKITNKQATLILSLVEQGYINSEDVKTLSNLTVTDAAQIISNGLKKAYNNPERLGEFKISDMYTKDHRGKIDRTKVNRYMKKGSIEHIEQLAEEQRNITIMDNLSHFSMPYVKYQMYKRGKILYDTSIGGLKTILGFLMLAGFKAPAAYMTNRLGATISNYIDGIRANRYAWKNLGKPTWERIRHGYVDQMTEGDAMLYHRLVALGLVDNNGLVSIVLEKANLTPADYATANSSEGTIRFIVKTLFQGFGYKKYYNTIKNLREEYLKKKGDAGYYRDQALIQYKTQNLNGYYANNKKALDAENEAKKIGVKLNRAKLAWEAKVAGIMDEFKEITPKETREISQKLSELKKAPENMKSNLASDLSLTSEMSTKMLLKTLKNKFFMNGYFGMGMQAKAEKGRRSAFLNSYYTAIINGYNKLEALDIAQNNVEFRHAQYGRANKQMGANTKLGTFLYQFAQYSYNSVSKLLKLSQEAMGQYYLHAPEVEKHKISKLKFLFQKMVEVNDANQQDEQKKYDINLANVILRRISLGYVLLQMSVVVMPGLGNMVDPFAQFTYDMFRLALQALTGDFPDDEDERETKQDIIWLLNESLIMIGMPIKLAISQIADITWIDPDKEHWIEYLPKGRVAGQAEVLDRLYNTYNVILDEMEGKYVTKSMQESTMMDVEFLVNRMSGLKLLGPVRTQSSPRSFKAHSDLLGDYEVEMRRPEGRIDTDDPFAKEGQRLLELINFQKSLLPYGDLFLHRVDYYLR